MPAGEAGRPRSADTRLQLAASVFAHSSEGIMITDPEAGILEVNEAFTRITGYSRDEALGRTPELFKSDRQDAAFYDRMWQVLASEGTWRGEVWNRRKDGELFAALLTISAVRDEAGAVQHYVGQFSDITERVRNEQMLERSRRQFELAIDAIAVGIWDWQVQTGEVTFNARWAELVGYTLEELQPVSIDTWMGLAHPDDLRQSEQLLNRHWRGETDRYVCEARMRHKQGHWVWVLDMGKVVEWEEDGRPKRMIGTHLDITERKRATEALSNSEARMRSLFELSPVGITLNDFETGDFVDVNHSTHQSAGYRRDEFLRLSYWDITPREYETREARQLASLRDTGRYGPYEKEFIRKDGSRYPVLLNGIRRRQPRQERFPGEHEPRDTHTDERRHRHDQSAAGQRPGPAAAGLRPNHPQQCRIPAEPDPSTLT